MHPPTFPPDSTFVRSTMYLAWRFAPPTDAWRGWLDIRAIAQFGNTGSQRADQFSFEISDALIEEAIVCLGRPSTAPPAWPCPGRVDGPAA